MLNANLITNQTGVEGRPCKNVLIQERIYARHEYYFAGNTIFLKFPSNDGQTIWRTCINWIIKVTL
jgi:hypothetical protein